MNVKTIKEIVRESIEDVTDALADEEIDEVCGLVADRIAEEEPAVEDDEDEEATKDSEEE